MNEDCRRLLLQFLGSQTNLKFLVLNQNRLDNNKVVELLGFIQRSPAVNTLETLWLNGNSWVDQTSWIALSELITAAPNLTKLHVKDQGQGGNAVKFELQPAGIHTAGNAANDD